MRCTLLHVARIYVVGRGMKMERQSLLVSHFIYQMRRRRVGRRRYHFPLGDRVALPAFGQLITQSCSYVEDPLRLPYTVKSYLLH